MDVIELVWFVLLMLLTVICVMVLPDTVRALRRYWILLRVPEPVPGHWLFGHVLHYEKTARFAVQRWQAWMQTLPRIQRTRIGPYTIISLCHPETAGVVLKTAEPKSNVFYRFLKPWIGNGLIVSGGKRWARDRRLLTRAFHFDILRHYDEIYYDAAGVLLEQWTDGCREDGELTVNVSRSSTLLTLDVILRCIMSYHSNCQNPRGDGQAVEYSNAVREVSHCLRVRFLSLLQHNNILFKLSANGRRFYKNRDLCHEVSQRIIKQRRATLADRGEQFDGECDGTMAPSETASRKSRYFDFLDILLMVRDDDGSGLSDKEIQEQVDTFLFAGHDTTATALQWAIYYLAKYPELQEKCRCEVREAVGESGRVTHEDLNQLTYLTQFIKESIRLRSTVPFIQRALTHDIVVDGYHLPAGTNISIPILALHHNPTVWEDPLRFDPERFTAENSAKRSPFAFVPFSAGPRNCIGQSLAVDELRTILSMILLNFRLCEDTTHPEPCFKAMLVARSHEDIHVRVQHLSG